MTSDTGTRSPYRNLVLEGGGVKGTAYAGAVQALHERGILQGIRRFAGTSAGAISATILTLGYAPGDFRRPKQAQPGTIFDTLYRLDYGQFKDGRGLLATLPRLMRSFGLYQGHSFQDWIRKEIVGAGHGLSEQATFADFHAAGLPELRIIGCNLATHEAVEFSQHQTPDFPVAEAVRISMSMPFFFEAVRDPLGPGGLFVDGGVLRNYPIEIFDSEEGPNPETLGLHLDLTKEPPPREIKTLEQYFAQLFETMHQTQSYLFERNQADVARTVRIDNLGVKAADFHIDSETKLALMQSGYDAVLRYLDEEPGG